MPITLLAQKINEKEIIGKWKVVEVLKKSNNPNFADLIKSFGSAVFEFSENSNFKLTTSSDTNLFKTITDMTKNVKWKLNQNNFVISIGNKSDGYSILKIIIVEANGKIIFHLSETELDLEVQKG